jgi:hypothetical protein
MIAARTTEVLRASSASRRFAERLATFADEVAKV